jgi:transcriptional regulator with XRE-family HTH domain
MSNRQELATQRLKDAMQQAGYSANRLAAEIEVPQTTLSSQLRRKAVPLPVLEKAAAVLGVSITWLLDDGTGAEDELAELESDESDAAVREVLERAQVIRTLKTSGPAGDERLRKLAILEGYKAVLVEFGPVPRWWHELREQVEAGEL